MNVVWEKVSGREVAKVESVGFDLQASVKASCGGAGYKVVVIGEGGSEFFSAVGFAGSVESAKQHSESELRITDGALADGWVPSFPALEDDEDDE